MSTKMGSLIVSLTPVVGHAGESNSAAGAWSCKVGQLPEPLVGNEPGVAGGKGGGATEAAV